MLARGTSGRAPRYRRTGDERGGRCSCRRQYERPGLDELAETYGARVLQAEELDLRDGLAHLQAIGLLVAKDRGDDGGALLGVGNALDVLTITRIEKRLPLKRVAPAHAAEVWR